jgi:predicted nucleic acid-binding protein
VTYSAAQRAIVIDTSVAIPFLQGEPGWERLVTGWLQAGEFLLVPPHFRFEVSNGLLLGTSMRSDADVIDRVRLLFEIGLEPADRGLAGLEATIRLAARHKLTVYDAAYLDLAMDVDGELATLDGALRKAAAAEGVPLVG